MRKLIIALSIFLVSCNQFETKISKVIDGDTFVTQDSKRIRLGNGIDAWELSQPMGKKAKRYAESLLIGKKIIVTLHGKDRYRRNVATINVDGQDLGLLLIRKGYAHATKWSNDEAKNAYFEAKAKGLFNNAVLPSEWRKTHKQ